MSFCKIFPRAASGFGKSPTFPQPQTDSRKFLAGLCSVRVMPGALNEAQAPSGSRQEATTRHEDTTRPRDDSTRRRQDLRKPQRVTTTRRHHTTPHDTTRYHATPPRDATTRRHDAARIRCSNSCSTINLPKAALRQPFDLQISRLRICHGWVASFEKVVVEKSANFHD